MSGDQVVEFGDDGYGRREGRAVSDVFVEDWAERGDSASHDAISPLYRTMTIPEPPFGAGDTNRPPPPPSHVLASQFPPSTAQPALCALG